MKKTIYILPLLIFISSCTLNFEDERVFPKLKPVSELKKTDFVPTLESSFNTENNIIYAATIPFAWNDIRHEIGTTLTGFTSKELQELNNTTSFINVLKEDEYKTSIEVNGNEISAKAYFKKALPYQEPLTKFKTPLKFGNFNVASFGFLGSCRYAKLNYFNNENEFSISLFPKNQEHEIILIMDQGTNNNLGDFKDYLLRYRTQKGFKRHKKVYFDTDDKVEIPMIEFNLEKTFDQIIGGMFYTELTGYTITEFYQRNAFILNEKGAEVESKAEIAVKEAVEDLEKKKPKKMIFNKPFVVLLKRKDVENPYFGVYISNAEILKKQ